MSNMAMALVVVDEFGTIEQRPEDIAQRPVLGGAGIVDKPNESGLFLGPRQATQGGQVECLYLPWGVEERAGQHGTERVVAIEASGCCDQLAIHHRQRLRNRALPFQ